MAFMNSGLQSLGDRGIWDEVNAKYGWSGNKTGLDEWSTVYWYEGKLVSDDLFKKIADATEYLWNIGALPWDSSRYDLAEKVIIEQSNMIRKEWDWNPVVSKSNPRPPLYATQVVTTKEDLISDVLPETKIINMESMDINKIDGFVAPVEHVKAGFFTPFNILVLAVFGGLGYYIYTRKTVKQSNQLFKL